MEAGTLPKKWVKQSINQAIKQDFDSMTTAAQRAAVMKNSTQS